MCLDVWGLNGALWYAGVLLVGWRRDGSELAQVRHSQAVVLLGWSAEAGGWYGRGHAVAVALSGWGWGREWGSNHICHKIGNIMKC